MKKLINKVHFFRDGKLLKVTEGAEGVEDEERE